MPVTIDGNAGITFPQGATQIVGAGPAFYAYGSATGQTFTSAVETKVILNTELFDTNNNFDSTTNYRFTPTVAGYYQVNAAIYGRFGTTFTQMYSVIYKNGAAFSYGNGFTSLSTAANAGSAVSTLVNMNGTTDYLEFYAYFAGTGTFTLTGGGALALYFNGSLIRGA